MHKLFKALIVWLMLVAIPFQGFAAASMLTCAPVRVAAGASVEHCAMMAMASHARTADGDDGAAHHADAKCSTCASCCLGAALAPSVPVVRMPGFMPAVTVCHGADDEVARVDLALPERPPKAS